MTQGSYSTPSTQHSDGFADDLENGAQFGLNHNPAILTWPIAITMNRRGLLKGLAGLTAFGRAGALAAPILEPWAKKLIAAAERQVGVTVHYDPTYVQLRYPGGDVPLDRGVCTDVVIRAYRDGLGIDLQKLVHEDMKKNFSAYPTNWSLKKPDTNIDHRRVPNLQAYFRRQKSSLTVSKNAGDYLPGDLISMLLPGRLPHIALITHHANAEGSRPLCVHNIGGGAWLEDVLFAYELTGHYRFKPSF
jgi:uncharacterized protein